MASSDTGHDFETKRTGDHPFPGSKATLAKQRWDKFTIRYGLHRMPVVFNVMGNCAIEKMFNQPLNYYSTKQLHRVVQSVASIPAVQLLFRFLLANIPVSSVVIAMR